MKQANLYNELVRYYNRSRRKLQSLAVEGKNQRKQHILQKRIVRLFKTLTRMQRALKIGMATTALSAGMLIFQPNAAHAQITFAAPKSSPFGLSDLGFYSSPALVDLDRDGDLDMMSGLYDGNFYYFQNIGTASAPVFSGAQINPFGLTGIGRRSHPAFADLDGDGDMDLMTGESGGKFIYFQNIGTSGAPEFTAAQTNPFGLTDIGSKSACAFVDLDGDGDMDLMGGAFGNFYYFKNTGSPSNPSFAAAQTNPFGLTDIGYTSSPTFADLDGDGDLDLMAGSSYYEFISTLFYFQNDGTPTAPAFAAVQINPFGLSPSNANYAAPAFADLDGDGDMDLMQGSYNGNLDYFQNNSSCSGLTVYADADGDHYGNAANSLIADDCIVPVGYVITSTDCNDNNVAIHPGASEIIDGADDNCNGINDDFSFVQVDPFGLTNIGGWPTIAFVDLDGDDDMDLMGGGFLYFENTGTSSAPAFAPPLNNPFGLTGGTFPSFADLDGDGDMDLLAGNGKNLDYFENIGTASAPAFAPPQTNPFGLTGAGNEGSSAPAFADLDGDGDMDLIEGITQRFYSYNYYGRFLYYQNVGTATAPAFAPPVINPFGLFAFSIYLTPALADLDNDGDMDLLAGEYHGALVYFENSGTASAPAFAAVSTSGLTGNSFFSTPALADLDADGDMDVMAGGYYNHYFYYKNNHACSGITVYADADGDQYGNAAESLFVADCIVPDGYVHDNTDCDDANAAINPGATEVANGVDDDCNGIIDDGVCAVPSNLAVTNITSSSAKVKWGSARGALRYKIRYKIAGTTEWTKIIDVKSNSKFIFGLTPNTLYYWETKSICSNNPIISSDWSKKQSFTTAASRIGDVQTASFELYPNPVSENFTLDLQLNSTKDQAATIFLLNALGQVVYSVKEVVGNGELKKEMTMPSSASSGWYIVKVVLNDQVMEKKLLFEK